MFGRRGISFLIGVVVAAGLLVIILVLLLSGGSPTKTPTKPLASYAGDSSAQVSLLIDGPEVAAPNHNQVQITITNYSATVNVIRGYDYTVINSKVFSNSESAFHVFLRSLEYSGFNEGSADSSLSQASGYCPLGNRYIFSFSADGSQRQRYWTTSCYGDPHTFNGNVGLTIQLFKSQIQGYGQITSGLNI